MIQCESTAVPQAATFSWTLSVKTSPEVPCFIIAGSQTSKSGSQRQNHLYLIMLVLRIFT